MTAPQTILIVEDETSIASFVALYLKNAGYNVTYKEFEGPHTLPKEIGDEAFRWFLKG